MNLLGKGGRRKRLNLGVSFGEETLGTLLTKLNNSNEDADRMQLSIQESKGTISQLSHQRFYVFIGRERKRVLKKGESPRR